MELLSSRFLLAGSAVLLVSACATTSTPPPSFDSKAPLESQVDTFMQTDRSTAKRMKSVQTLAVTSCNVLFAQKSSASASTGGGLFSEAGGRSRIEAKVSHIYTLEGVNDAGLQVLADKICTDAERSLKASGYPVKPYAELRANPHYAKLVASAKVAPFEHGIGSGGTKQEYRVFARSGGAVHGADYLGTMGGLAQAFKAVGSDSSWHHEARLMNDLKVDAVHVDVLVDFTRMSSSGTPGAYALASTNSAQVSGDAHLAISGKLRIIPLADLKCWDRFGNHECGELHDPAQVRSKLPISGGEVFYESLEDTTTTGDKAAYVVTKALSVLGALGGIGGGASTDISRYTITVKPATYDRLVQQTSGQFLDMSTLALKREAGR